MDVREQLHLTYPTLLMRKTLHEEQIIMPSVGLDEITIRWMRRNFNLIVGFRFGFHNSLSLCLELSVWIQQCFVKLRLVARSPAFVCCFVLCCSRKIELQWARYCHRKPILWTQVVIFYYKDLRYMDMWNTSEHPVDCLLLL